MTLTSRVLSENILNLKWAVKPRAGIGALEANEMAFHGPRPRPLRSAGRPRGRGAKAIVAVIAGISLFAGLVGFFTLQFELHSGRELSLDGGVLIAVAAGFGLFVAHRKFK